MKTFTFDAIGNMTVKNVTMGTDEKGAPMEQTTQSDIQPEQIAAHLPMFQADMSAAELAQARAIIEGLAGA
jgi:hypothetical protein